MLDPTTLLFAISVLGFATAAFAYSSSRAIGSEGSGLLEWGQAMLALAFAFLLFFLRGRAPSFLTYLVANGMLMPVAALTLLAQARFFGIKAHRPTIVGLVGFGISGPAAVHLFGMALGVGVFTMSIAIAVLLSMTAGLIVQHKGLGASAPGTFAVAVITLLILACLGRAAVSVAGGGVAVSLSAGSVHSAWSLVVGMLFVVGATIGFVMMVHDRRRLAELEGSRRDSLTGLRTREAFFEAAKAVQLLADEPYALVVLDIDHFKGINDSNGHAGGDMVLAQAGHLILRSIRNHDLAGRFGGDEFCIVLRGCGQHEAGRFAERLVREGSKLKVQLPNGHALSFTMSAGYATRVAQTRSGETLESVEQLFERADAALYEAKRRGRTRAIGASDQGSVGHAAMTMAPT